MSTQSTGLEPGYFLGVRLPLIESRMRGLSLGSLESSGLRYDCSIRY